MANAAAIGMTTRNTIVTPCIVKTWLYRSADSSLWPGIGELGPDQQRLEAADEEEEERGDAVHDADLLVIDGGDPGLPAGVDRGRANTPSGLVVATAAPPVVSSSGGRSSVMAISAMQCSFVRARSDAT